MDVHSTRRLVQVCLGLVVVLGCGRIAFYYLIHEPLAVQARPEVGPGYLPLRSLVGGLQEIGYLSDEPLDEDPASPRRFDGGDMLYARAQYALAPTILSRSGTASPLVLANFADAAALDGLIQSGRYTVLERTGPTVALLKPK